MPEKQDGGKVRMIRPDTSATKHQVAAIVHYVRELRSRLGITGVKNIVFFACFRLLCNLKKLAFLDSGPQLIKIVIAFYQLHCCRQ